MAQCNARVLSTDADHVWVEVAPRDVGCGNCDQPGGCHSGFFSKDKKTRRYRVANLIDAEVGEEVQLVTVEHSLLKVSMLVYGGPTLLLMVGAAIGQALEGNLWAVIGGVAGLISGVVLLHQTQSFALENAKGEPILSLRKSVSTTCQFMEQK